MVHQKRPSWWRKAARKEELKHLFGAGAIRGYSPARYWSMDGDDSGQFLGFGFQKINDCSNLWHPACRHDYLLPIIWGGKSANLVAFGHLGEQDVAIMTRIFVTSRKNDNLVGFFSADVA